MKEILILFPCDPMTRQRLEAAVGNLARCTFREESWTPEEYRAALDRAHIIIGEPRNEDFAFCTRLELMQSPSSGTNYYVQGGAFPKDAILCSMTGRYGPIIAEHLLALVFALCRRIPEYRDQQKEGRWKLKLYDKQLSGTTVLILGAGDIGTTVARWMRPMVGKIIGMRRVERPFPDCYDTMITPEQLDEALPLADIVICALPHTPQTVGMLNEDRLRRMKGDAILVNAGRGSLIDQEALCRVLESGHLWGVGLDVTVPEPLPADHPLWQLDRVLITPHAAGNSFAMGSPLYHSLWEAMTENVCAWLRGEPVKYRTDFTTGYRVTGE